MKMYTSKEAAAFLGYSNSSAIRQHILAGKLKATKKGKTWLILERDLKKFMKNYTYPKE